jgi:hypothetical protein
MNRTVTNESPREGLCEPGGVSGLGAKSWSDLDAYGCAAAEGMLLPEQYRALAALYDQDGCFRGRIVMSHHELRPRRIQASC